MRLFVALDLDDTIRERIARFMDGIRNFAPEVRWVRPESLHVTLKFIGEKPPAYAEQIGSALRTVQAAPVTIRFEGYGFFPTPRSARVLWIGMQAGAALASLAASVDEAMHSLGVSKEEHPFTPHLTLARSGSGAPRRQKGDGPNRNFQRLQDKLAALPTSEFGTMTAQEFFLFESELGRGGARYKKIARFALA